MTPRQLLRRAKALPTVYDKSLRFTYKKYAEMTVIIFQEGIERDQFKLKRLQPSTKRRKKQLGYKHPATPLFGRGGKKSYSRLLTVYEQKNGYSVRARNGKHHSGLTFRQILDIHENSRVIKRKTKEGVAVIVIPPRRAFGATKKKVVRTISARTDARMIKRMATELLKTGKSRTLGKLQREVSKLEKKRSA